MPIFTSRFSSERSLLGTFLSTRSQKETEEPQNRRKSADSQGTPQTDRLDLSERTAEVRTTPAPEPADRETRRPSLQAQVSENLPFAQQLRLQRVAQEASAVERAQEPTPPPPEPTGTAPESVSEFRIQIRQETQISVQNATPARLEEFLNGLTAFRDLSAAIQEENQAASETAAPESLEALVEAASEGAETALPPPVAADPVSTPALQTPTAEEPPSREIQQEALRQDLRTIADGLRADAAIENRISVEQTARSTARAVEQQQSQQIQDNQGEIRSLQTSRRQLQQDVQQTDQAIRQLQNQNNRLQNGQQTGAGASLDILAQ